MSLISTAALLLAIVAPCLSLNVSTYNFITRPDIKAPVLKPTTFNRESTAPGYIMMTPATPVETNFTRGPMIYASDGNFVWFGSADVAEGFEGVDLQACPYQGSTHLCYTQYQGPVDGGVGGVGSFTKILDSSYTTIQTVLPNSKWEGHNLTHDLHEFNPKNGGTSAMIISYVPIQRNITFPLCNNSEISWLKTGVFSEVSTAAPHTEIFQWAAVGHVDPTDSEVCPGDVNAGTGKQSISGFDFFHMNAVDKDDQGDYLVSGRHVSTVYKIAGLNNSDYAPGTIIWRLGGRNNTFPHMLSDVPNAPNLNFSFQHHARFAPSVNGISLWDNANNGQNPPSALASSGMAIGISSDAQTATLVGQYVSPFRQLDQSQGSLQFLDNGNRFNGMGSDPVIYEYTATGQLVYYAAFGRFPLSSYRSFKYEWTGAPPLSQIAAFAYAKSCNGTAAFYASWNGATEIDTWKFFTASEESGAFALAATKAANGSFETMGTGNFDLYAYGQAFDASGTMLGQTPTVATFVPGAELVGQCGADACPWGTNYTTAPKTTCAAPAGNSTSHRR